MKTNTKIFATLGVVAGLGLAAFPAFSYALDVSGDVDVETEVTPSLAMRIHSNADATGEYGFIGYNPATAEGSGDPAAAAGPSQATGLSLSSNQADTTTLYSNISIRSNTGKFKLEVTDADTDNALRNEAGSTTENQYIPAGITTTTDGTSGDTIIDPTVAGWAFKGGDITSWTTMPISTATPATIAALGTNTTNPLSYSTDITVNYAVSSGLTKTDTYSDIITYTATALDSDYSLNDGNMQDFSAAEHAGDEAGTTYVLVDSRDGQEYTAAKLADGNIWMTQDLKLGGDSALTLTSADSDVSSNFTLATENTGEWCKENSSACDDQSLMRKTGAPNGYLYNWYAATAGSGTYSTAANVNVNSSICPKGWKLPTGGASGQFAGLDVAYGGNGSDRSDATQRDKFMAAPLNFNYTGYVSGGSVVNHPSDYAHYWSCTANSETYAYGLRFDSNGNFNPQHGNRKWFGFAVRCVAAS